MALYAIRRPVIRKVAVVSRPANGRTLILKQGEAQIIAPILKAEGDWKIAYAVIAEPGTPEGGGITADGQVAKGDDGQPIRDVWDEQSIREACHSFARAGAQMTVGHFTDDTAGSFVESFIAPADMMVAGHPVKAGSWVLGLDPSAEMRAAIDSGAMAGFSVEGDAHRELVAHSQADDLDLILAILAKGSPTQPRVQAGSPTGGQWTAGNSPTPSKSAQAWANVALKLSTQLPAKKGAAKKALRAKIAAARKAHALAAKAERQHLSRVKRHQAQHVARLKRHASAASKRAKAAQRAHAKALALQARTARQAQAQAKKTAKAPAKTSTPKASAGNAKQRAAQAKLNAMSGAISPVAKGIGSTDKRPLGPKPLWGKPGLTLPAGIEHIASRLIAKGMPESQAIATAVAAVKQGCATGKFGATTLTPEKRAEACRVSREWAATKAKA